MNPTKINRSLLVGIAWVLIGVAAPAQDSVTIPKSRLEELERKERELDRLKGDVKQTQDENARLKKQAEAAAKAPVTPRVELQPVHVAPPMASLPPLKPGEVVESLDLAAHYRVDAAAADQRYRGRKFILRGEIIGFEKPLLRSDYKILLNTPERDVRVVCDLYPSAQYNAVFIVNHGAELVGLIGETRVHLAKIGDRVKLKAQCEKFKDSAVLIAGGELQPAP